MTLIQFYGVLASTASIFVGILTAYLVTRYSDLKTQRSRIQQRADSVEAEQEALLSRKNFRIDQLEQTEAEIRHKEAEEDVNSFMKFGVGDSWNPPADSVTLEDAMYALAAHQDIDENDLIQHHANTLREHWDGIIDLLDPRRMASGEYAAISGDDSTPIIKHLWKIYRRERYDHHTSLAEGLEEDIDELEDEWELLVEEDKSLDPQQLQDGIKSAAVPIVLSVMFPLFIRLLHELGWTYSSSLAWIEPVAVSIVWLVGFLWTLGFLWKRVSDSEEPLNELPPSQRETSESTEPTEDSNPSDDDPADVEDATSQDDSETEPAQ